jgi:hypothetical protein
MGGPAQPLGNVMRRWGALAFLLLGGLAVALWLIFTPRGDAPPQIPEHEPALATIARPAPVSSTPAQSTPDTSTGGVASDQSASKETLPAEAPGQIPLPGETGSSLTGEVRFHGAKLRKFSIVVAKAFPGATDREILSTRLALVTVQGQWRSDNRTFAFAASEAPEGDYVVGLFGGSRALIESRRVSVSTEQVFAAFELHTPTHDRTLRLLIERPEIIRPRDETITVSAPGFRSLPIEVWEVSASEYLLELWPKEGALPETGRVQVESWELGQVGTEFRPGVDRVVGLRFETAASVRLRVNNLPVSMERADLVVAPGPDFKKWQNLTVNWAHTVAGQEVQLQAFQPGEYRFEVRGDEFPSLALAGATLNLTRGDNLVTLTVPKVYRVTIERNVREPHVYLVLEHVRTGLRRQFVFEDCSATFRALPSGEYRIHYGPGISHGLDRTYAFTLPGTETVNLPE